MWYKKKTYKYYIQIINENNKYVMQTKLFDTKTEAMNWLKENIGYFDFVNNKLQIIKSEDCWGTNTKLEAQIDFDTLCKLRGY